jgi:hypothetical protein
MPGGANDAADDAANDAANDAAHLAHAAAHATAHAGTPDAADASATDADTALRQHVLRARRSVLYRKRAILKKVCQEGMFCECR